MNETNMPAKRKKKKNRRFILSAILILCIYFFVSPYIREYVSSDSIYGETVIFTVNEGATASDIAQKLEDEGLIKSKYTFIIKYRMSGDKYHNIYHGTYYLNKGLCLTDIMNKLAAGPPESNTITLTIPEGYSIELIAVRCEQLGICSKEKFIEAATSNEYDYEFIKYIPEGNYRNKLEGFLFPSTYEFFADVTPVQIVDKMLATFESEYNKNFSSYDKLFENITIAAMIEREAALDSERATISGVIQNRLKKPMRLQLDATAVYAKTNGYYDISDVSGKDVQFDSEYNTYLCDGLPPGPICNPGIKSIIAAANPESHNWYYYHTDETKKDGSHIFTENYDDHVSTMN